MKIPRISPEIYGLFHSLIQGSFFSFQSTRRTTPAATRTPATIPMGIQIENDDFSPASPPLSGFPATAALDESASPADEPSPCKVYVVAASEAGSVPEDGSSDAGAVVGPSGVVDLGGAVVASGVSGGEVGSS